MSEDWVSELAERLVVGRKSDGRCIYDPQAKRELILASRDSGMSLSKLARACGVNANQLSSWVRLYELETAAASLPKGDVREVEAPAFVPVHIDTAAAAFPATPASIDLQARLPNGVMVDLRGCDMLQVGDLVQMLGRLRCSASTKG